MSFKYCAAKLGPFDLADCRNNVPNSMFLPSRLDFRSSSLVPFQQNLYSTFNLVMAALAPCAFLAEAKSMRRLIKFFQLQISPLYSNFVFSKQAYTGDTNYNTKSCFCHKKVFFYSNNQFSDLLGQTRLIKYCA